MSDSRDQALRRMLVEQTSTMRRPFPLTAVLGSVGVVAVLAAGAVFAVGIRFGEPVPADPPIPAHVYQRPSFVHTDVSVIGETSVAVGSGAVEVEMGPRPSGATMLAVGVTCLDPGPYSFEMRADVRWYGTCRGGPKPVGGLYVEVDDSAEPTVAVTAFGGRIAIWVAWVDRPPTPEPSAGQRAALADDVVTREEYLAAFDGYLACLDDLGFSVYVNDRDQEILFYSVDHEAQFSARAEDCYTAEFQLVDATWQVAHRD